MALIYQGIVHHGWRFPFTWRFNQDNQTLILLPYALIFYATAGISGASIVVQGWIVCFCYKRRSDRNNSKTYIKIMAVGSFGVAYCPNIAPHERSSVAY